MQYTYKREPLTNEQADQLCSACKNSKEKLVIWVLLDTGLRISELCKLTSKNILWQQSALKVSGKGGIYGKMTKTRVVPMSRRVKALLEPYFALNNEWFIGTRACQLMVKRVANRSKLSVNITPHVLRHTFATLSLQKGISISSVQKVLGHDSILTTQIYLNLTPVHVLDEFQRKF